MPRAYVDVDVDRGVTRPLRLDVSNPASGLCRGTFAIRQTEFGITPYSGFFGTLELRDDIEVVVETDLGRAPRAGDVSTLTSNSGAFPQCLLAKQAGSGGCNRGGFHVRGHTLISCVTRDFSPGRAVSPWPEQAGIRGV